MVTKKQKKLFLTYANKSNLKMLNKEFEGIQYFWDLIIDDELFDYYLNTNHQYHLYKNKNNNSTVIWPCVTIGDSFEQTLKSNLSFREKFL